MIRFLALVSFVVLAFSSCKTSSVVYCEGKESLTGIKVCLGIQGNARCAMQDKEVDHCEVRSKYDAECTDATHSGFSAHIFYQYPSPVRKNSKPSAEEGCRKSKGKFTEI